MKIVLFAAGCFERWSPDTARERGIGGSEHMLMELSWALAERGHQVAVYGEVFEGIYDSPNRPPSGPSDLSPNWGQVEWRDWSRPLEPCDVYIASRAAGKLHREAKLKIFWAHDTWYGDQATQELKRFDGHITLTNWHREFFLQKHGIDSVVIRNAVPGRLLTMPSGVTSRKKPHTYIYASSPDRGLAETLVLFQQIRARQPDARLIVAYGDKSLRRRYQSRGESDRLAELDRLMGALSSTPGVEFVSRVTRARLVELFAEATDWLYPTKWEETSCLVAMEAQLHGVRPWTSGLAALSETVLHGPKGVFTAEEVLMGNNSPYHPDHFTIATEAWSQFVLEDRMSEWENVIS